MMRVLSLLAMLCVAATSAAAQMPNPREMSGRPLPSTDVPPGTLSVRVLRGGFENNVANHPVEIVVDGARRTVNTGEDGRALVSGLRVGNNIQAIATVDGERLESQVFPMPSSGVMMMLVAAAGAGATEADTPTPAAPAVPAVPGTVQFGPESRVIVELAESGLTVFYVLQIMNGQTAPVDIGGPLIVNLPREARGVGLLRESSPQATANGPRVIVTGPFAPGATVVQLAYELPYRGATARLEQVWPAAMPQTTVIAQTIAGLDYTSPQVTAKNPLNDQGQTYLFGSGPGLAEGQTLTIDFTGLPHHPMWPQWTAIAIALGIIAWGALAAMRAPGRTRAAGVSR
jgi:hypothetical protein